MRGDLSEGRDRALTEPTVTLPVIGAQRREYGHTDPDPTPDEREAWRR